MKGIVLILFSLAIFVHSKPAEKDDQNSNTEEEDPNEMKEVFCIDNLDLYFMGPDQSVTTPPGTNRLRVWRFKDGKLLLHFEEQKILYPLLPNVTPVLHTEDGAIVIPDLEVVGGAIGLKLPKKLDVVLNDILHQGPSPPPSKDVKIIISNADAIADLLVFQAEQMKKYIEGRAAQYMMGAPAEDHSHRILRTGAKGAKIVTSKVEGVTGWATGLVDKATNKVGVKVAPHVQKGAETIMNRFSKNKENETKEQSEVVKAGVAAMEKISEAFSKSLDIVKSSLKENTLQVAHHKYGAEMVDVMESGLYTVTNTVKSVNHVMDLRPNKIVTRSAKNVLFASIKSQEPSESSKYKCKKELR